MRDAVPSIVDITRFLEGHPAARLAGLEHLDERYVKAVGYATKAKGGHGRPKMVLLGDIVGDDETAVAEAASHVVNIANVRGGEGFIAVSAEARKLFWLDRARTAAIAKHTNAFKINEDVVIPLARLGDYSDGIERINIELSIRNKLALCDALDAFLAGELPIYQEDAALAKAQIIGDKSDYARSVIADVRRRWQWIVDHLDMSCRDAAEQRRQVISTAALAQAVADLLATHPGATVFDVIQNRSRRISWKTELHASLTAIFDGVAYRHILARIEAIHAQVLRSRVFVALHMHAGDGNVHTNIPVNSDNYEMLQEANRAVARIMALARRLDGVISGEHGIGITKLEFLSAEEIAPFADYKARIDPEGRFNKGKLLRDGNEPDRPAQCLHALVQPLGHRVADNGAVGDRQDLRLDQGLPALRQVQAGVLDTRAARQPALFAARQDPRHLAVDRGFPV